jgi:hypothetical protein
MHVSTKTLQEVEEALREYERDVQASDMTPSTKHTYLLHSTNFVRWLKGDFVPGGRKE